MFDQALENLRALGNSQAASDIAKYHKIDREYLGVTNPQIDLICKEWRSLCTLSQRIELARSLWDTNIHEARIAAAKLFTQARITPDEDVWAEIIRWVPQFDAWAVSDHACIAGQKRLIIDPSRLDQVETWITDDNKWVRRAALVMTLPWSKLNNPKPADLIARERILGWAASYVPDHDWFIQKSIAWWLRTLSKRDPDRVVAFLNEHQDAMKPFAVKEASRTMRS